MSDIKKTALTVVLCVFYAVMGFAVREASAVDFNGEWLGEKTEWAPDASLSTTFLTKYIWRGFNLGDEPVMQTDASISEWGFTLNFWTNYSLNDEKTRDGGRYQEFTEADYTIDYTFGIGDALEAVSAGDVELLDPLSVSVGYTYYTFPNVDWDSKAFDTHEVYVGVAYDTLLQPAFTWYWDVGHGKGNTDGGGDGSYFLFGIGHTFEFDSGISADIGITAAYNDEQWTDKSGWADMVFSGGVNIPVANYFTITPTVAYSLILDRDTYNDGSENEFYGGITVGFAY